MGRVLSDLPAFLSSKENAQECELQQKNIPHNCFEDNTENRTARRFQAAMRLAFLDDEAATETVGAALRNREPIQQQHTGGLAGRNDTKTLERGEKRAPRRIDTGDFKYVESQKRSNKLTKKRQKEEIEERKREWRVREERRGSFCVVFLDGALLREKIRASF